MDTEDPVDVDWMVVQRRDQKIVHVTPVGDVIGHRVLVDSESPLQLRDGIVLACPCRPSVCVEPDGSRVVLHQLMANRAP